MKAPSTQEEINYRESLTNKISAISNAQGLFSDIEDKPRRLRILKTLLSSLNYGDEINTEIDAEIKALEEAAAAEAESGDESDTEASEESADTSGGAEDISSDSSGDDLGSLDALESFGVSGTEPLLEDVFLFEDDLPKPSELELDKDFSSND